MGTTELAGAGAVISTVQDYGRWLKCLLHENEPFSKDVHNDIKKPRMLITTEPTRGADIVHYGLGWARKVYRGHVVYSHSGGMHAYGAQTYWVPEANFGAVAFANTSWSSNAVEDIIIYRLIEDKLGIAESERFDFDGEYVATDLLKNGMLTCFPQLGGQNRAVGCRNATGRSAKDDFPRQTREAFAPHFRYWGTRGNIRRSWLRSDDSVRAASPQ